MTSSLVLGDRLGEAGKVIVGLVVFAHVIEAEAVILPLEPPSLGRGVGRAPCSRAGRKADRVAQEPILVGLDPQPVEEFESNSMELAL